ncbi:hypothetical protein YQE_08456, partial [Dendroctonus ponderosae]
MRRRWWDQSGEAQPCRCLKYGQRRRAQAVAGLGAVPHLLRQRQGRSPDRPLSVQGECGLRASHLPGELAQRVRDVDVRAVPSALQHRAHAQVLVVQVRLVLAAPRAPLPRHGRAGRHHRLQRYHPVGCGGDVRLPLLLRVLRAAEVLPDPRRQMDVDLAPDHDRHHAVRVLPVGAFGGAAACAHVVQLVAALLRGPVHPAQHHLAPAARSAAERADAPQHPQSAGGAQPVCHQCGGAPKRHCDRH